MVKSRRMASASQSSVNFTLARRPSVSTSWRSVVTSIGVVIDHHRHRAMLDAGGMNAHAARRAGLPSPARAKAWWRGRPPSPPRPAAHCAPHRPPRAPRRPLPRWRRRRAAGWARSATAHRRGREARSWRLIHQANRDCGSCRPSRPRCSAPARASHSNSASAPASRANGAHGARGPSGRRAAPRRRPPPRRHAGVTVKPGRTMPTTGTTR